MYFYTYLNKNTLNANVFYFLNAAKLSTQEISYLLFLQCVICRCGLSFIIACFGYL